MLKKTAALYTQSFTGLSIDIWLLSLVTIINRSGTMVIPFIAIYLTQELSFSYIEAGAVMSCFGLGSVVGSYVGGLLTDKFGHFYIMFWSLFLGGIFFFSLLFIESFYMWCVGVFIATAIADCYRPANMASIGFYSKSENRTRSMALIRLAINLGFALGPALGGLIASAFGYKWIFIIDGATCISSALFFYFVFKEKEKAKRAILRQKKEEEEKKKVVAVKPPSPYKDRVFLKFTFLSFLNSIVFIQFMGSLLLYFKEVLHYDDYQVGLLLAMNGLIICFIEMPIVYILEKKANILLLIAAGIFLTGLSYEMLAWTSWAGIAVVCMFALTLGEIINFPFASSFALSRAEESNRGAYMGLFGMSFSVGHIIAPIIGMRLIEWYGYDFLWHTMGILGFFTFLGMLALERQTDRSKKAEQVAE